MTDYQIVTVKQFQALLAEAKGAKIISLTTVTYPSLKKDCPFKEVTKVTEVNAIVNWDYGKAVNRQRERENKEADFKPQKRAWGSRLDGLPFVSHLNKEGEHKLYLETKVEKILSTEYKDESGYNISEEHIQPFLTKKGNENQGLDKEIVLRDYDVDNIVTIKIDGNGYILKH